MEFSDQSWNFTYLSPNFRKCVAFLQFKFDLERAHFATISAKKERDTNEKSRNSHGKVIESSFAK